MAFDFYTRPNRIGDMSRIKDLPHTDDQKQRLRVTLDRKLDDLLAKGFGKLTFEINVANKRVESAFVVPAKEDI